MVSEPEIKVIDVHVVLANNLNCLTYHKVAATLPHLTGSDCLHVCLGW